MLTEPQVKTIPLVAEGKNVLLVAPTGIGKTEAAILPLMSWILDENPERISVLYITPLRALNRDMLERMRVLGEMLNIDVAVRHGDTSQSERSRQSRHPPQILITTPETFQIMFTGSRLRKHLKHVRSVVVDEIHELASDERGGQLAVGLERLVSLAGREIQRIGLSATVGTPQEISAFLAGVGREIETVVLDIPKGMRIEVNYPQEESEDAKLSSILRMSEDHAAAVRRCGALIEMHRSTLFFVNTRDTAEFLASRFKHWKGSPEVGVHHGSLSKGVRIRMEDEFKGERTKALICTSSMELGIDVGSADFVLQYNSPRQVTRLVQRIGRSGHGVGEVSDGMTITTSPDDFAEACAIARRALDGELEDSRVRENDLAVLANQIVAFTMSQPSYHVDEAFEIVTRAYCFRNLRKGEFLEVLKQLSGIGAIWLRDDWFGRTRGSLTYFYENISMIPDVKTYKVIDITTRRTVGTLDEWFVSEHAKLGATFIMRGSSWRFVEFKDSTILVEPIAEMGSVPSWLGEEIPVPFDVAMEVGRLRRLRDFSRYPCNELGIQKFEEYLVKQGDNPVPSDKVVTIEAGRKTVIINACFGSKVNETLGQLISSFVSARIGESVGIQTDPYRIVLSLPERYDPVKIKELLSPSHLDGLYSLMRVILRNSTYMRRVFVHVAKKFGAIRRDVDWDAVNIPKMFKAYENTPLFDEAIEKAIWERLDIEKTEEVLRMIVDGEIEVRVGPLSHIGKAGIERSRAFLIPREVDRETLFALKKRIEDSYALLFCLNCGSTRRVKVGDLPPKIGCLVCEGLMVAAAHPAEREKTALFKKKHLTAEEKKEVRRIQTSANLVKAHGKRAVLAMMARGVGTVNAARILRRFHESEEDFLRDILSAEVTYARTRRFWD
ncbi:MAG: DEAD/DEAH box helicase [Thermoplasmata archaeon]